MENLGRDINWADKGSISHNINLAVYPTLFQSIVLPFISRYKQRTDDDLELLN